MNPHKWCAPLHSSLQPCSRQRSADGSRLGARGQFDGWRLQLHKHGEDVRFYSRNGRDLTRRFAELRDHVVYLPDCIIDAELVACDTDGKPDFQARMRRDLRLVLRSARSWWRGFAGTAPHRPQGQAPRAAVSLAGDLTPAQITANQNDYNPANLAIASVLRLDSNPSRDITGLAGGADGRVLTILNIGSKRPRRGSCSKP